MLVVVAVIVVAVVNSHKVWGKKWCTQCNRKRLAGEAMTEPKGTVDGFIGPDWLGLFLRPLVQSSSCERTTGPTTALHHTTLNSSSKNN